MFKHFHGTGRRPPSKMVILRGILNIILDINFNNIDFKITKIKGYLHRI